MAECILIIFDNHALCEQRISCSELTSTHVNFIHTFADSCDCYGSTILFQELLQELKSLWLQQNLNPQPLSW